MSFIKDYVEYASELTDANINFHTFVGLSILSTTLSNKNFFMFGDQKIYPNLWIILIAPSSQFRKSTCINIGKRLLDHSLILPSEFSHEALVELLAKKPRGCFFFSEFMSLMGLLQREYMSGVKALLTELYDSPEYFKRITREKETEIKNVCLNFLSATTKEWFLKNTKESDMMAGFLPRFLFIPAWSKEQDLPIPPAVDEEKRRNLYDNLQSFNNVKTGQMKLSDEAYQEYKEFYIKYKTHQHDILDAFFRRFEIYCIKFAMLHEKDKNKQSNIISRESVKEATNNVNWITRQLIALYNEEFAFTQFQANTQKFVKFLKSRGGRASRVDVFNYTHLRKIEIEEIIKTLIVGEKLQIIMEKTDGRDKIFYKLS